MFHSLYSQVAIFALVLTCALAFWKGGVAERAGALLIALTWLVTLIASAVTQSYIPGAAFLVSDGLMALGLLFLALRFSSLWMGAAMLVQAIALGFHGAYYSAEQAELSAKTLSLYILGKNLASVGLLLIIIAATIASWVKRARSRNGDAERKAGMSLTGAAAG